MANLFTTNFLRLGKQLVTTTGNSLFVNGVDVTFLLSGFLTGVSGTLSAANIASGASEIAHSNGIGQIISGNLTQTGVALGAQINNVSGAIQAQIGAVKVTGSSNLLLANFSGVGGTTVTLSGSLVVISSSGLSIPVATGNYFFRTPITQGVSKQFINYPVTLASDARIVATLYNNYDDTLLTVQTSGAVSTGFWALFSNYVPNTGYFIDALAVTQNTVLGGGGGGSSSSSPSSGVSFAQVMAINSIGF